MRYRLSRMSWRGIRFSFQGRVRPYAWLWIKGLLLTVVTLGLYRPYFQMRIRRFLTGHSRFGTRSFEFDGKGGDVFRRFILNLILLLPTLGISQLWYQAHVHRYSWGRTSLESAQFRSTVTGGGLFKLYLVNALLVIFALGLAKPWATVRTLRYQMGNLHLDGEFDLGSIEQDYQAAEATADEMGDVLALDMVDIGFGL